MDATKRLFKNLGSLTVFCFFTIFPFGQLLRFNFHFSGIPITLHPLDLIAFLSLFLTFLIPLNKPKFLLNVKTFILFCLFSLIVSLSEFSVKQVFIGSLFLIRFISYTSLITLIWNLVKRNYIEKIFIFNSLIAVSVFTAIFGWIQYIWYIDLRFLVDLGWDDHVGRLVSTFLDPGYTGIILVMGIILTIAEYLNEKKNRFLFISLFLLVSLALTYSRAAFLALIAGGLLLAYLNKSKKIIIVVFACFLISLPFLPRPRSEGVRLERTQSIFSRLSNYKQTIDIFRTSPLYGVGFNNICWSRLKIFGGEINSHACYGADSSLLFILATTGVLGLISYIFIVVGIINNLNKDIYGKSLLSCFLAVFTHSFFLNSLFYPWLMGYLFILLSISIKGKK